MRWVSALAVLLGVARAPFAAPTDTVAPAPVKQVVRYANDRVSVTLEHAPLDAVLQELAKQSGADLIGATRDARELTMTFEDVSVQEALERMVGAQNFTLKYDEKGELRSIELRGDKEALRRPPPVPLSPDENRTPAKEYAFWKAFDRRDPVPLKGSVAKLFGTDQAPWDHLGNAAIAQPEARARRAAMRAMVQALEDDPEMRDQVMAALDAMTDAELAAFARARTKSRAEDFVRNVLRETPEKELRDRARGVLRELKKNPYTGPPPDFH